MHGSGAPPRGRPFHKHKANQDVDRRLHTSVIKIVTEIAGLKASEVPNESLRTDSHGYGDLAQWHEAQRHNTRAYRQGHDPLCSVKGSAVETRNLIAELAEVSRMTTNRMICTRRRITSHDHQNA